MTQKSVVKPSRSALISMAEDFAAFLLGQDEMTKRVNKIVIFGSVARGDYQADSDIDIFIDAEPDLERGILKMLELWRASKRAQDWRISGIENEISAKIGHLEKWPALHRAIIADGIQLYGKYIEVPKGMKQYLLIALRVPRMSPTERVVLSRQLFGYSQKVGKKVYTSRGLVGKLGGQRMARGVLILPAKSAPEFFEFLRKRRISCTSREVWSD